jgi:hypothetical protein
VSTESPADDDTTVDLASAYCPPAEMTPAEFEKFVAEFLTVEYDGIEDLRVTPHKVIEVPDGRYNFDATVRSTIGGMKYLVLAEAKRHKSPIKRELVATLHGKVQSVGAHKAVMFTTSTYQSGAVTYAKAHGIALVKVTEGRFTYEVRSADWKPSMSREDARKHLGLADFVGIQVERGEPGTTISGVIGPDDDEWIARNILGIDLD